MSKFDCYKDKCPACGGSLSVVSLEWSGRMPLHADGFCYDEADGPVETDNEKVECDNCHKRFPLSKLTY